MKEIMYRLMISNTQGSDNIILIILFLFLRVPRFATWSRNMIVRVIGLSYQVMRSKKCISTI